MKELIHLPVWNMARKIRERELTSKELVQACLDRIELVNPRLNAVVQLAGEQALEEAGKADKELKAGNIRGALHGVPMTLKDSFDSKGIVSSGGTLGRANEIPRKDATVLTRLKQSGAVLLGKTNTSELTLSYDTNNLVYGRTKNPFDFRRIPGGSSGGAAAIVAAGGSPFDIGSDYGGSLRYPAHCCGLCTLKPTSGRVPRSGHILPFGGFLDAFQQVGPLTRSVRDLGYILPLISGPDGIDPSIVPMPLRDPADIRIETLKVAFHTANGILGPSAETVNAVKHAASLLAGRVRLVEEKRPAGIEKSYELMMQLLAADGGASIRRMLRDAGTEKHSVSWLKHAHPTDFDTFDALMMDWSRFRSRMLGIFREYDVLLCPVNAFPAAPQDTLRDDLRAFSYTMTFNLTGYPVVVIRAGSSPEKLPIGIQIIAAPWREDIALALAAFLEDALGPFDGPDI
jgi:amidase